MLSKHKIAAVFCAALTLIPITGLAEVEEGTSYRIETVVRSGNVEFTITRTLNESQPNIGGKASYDHGQLIIRKEGREVVRCELLPSQSEKKNRTYKFAVSADYIAESALVLWEDRWTHAIITDFNNKRIGTKEMLWGDREYTIQLRDYAKYAKNVRQSK